MTARSVAAAASLALVACASATTTTPSATTTMVASPLERALLAAGVAPSVAAIPFATTYADVVRRLPASRFSFGVGREVVVDGREVWFRFEDGASTAASITDEPEPRVDAPLRRLHVWGDDTSSYAAASAAWDRAVAAARTTLAEAPTCEQYVVRRDFGPDRDRPPTRARTMRANVADTGSAPAVLLEIVLVSHLDTTAAAARGAANVIVSPLPDERDAAIAALLHGDGATIPCPAAAPRP